MSDRVWTRPLTCRIGLHSWQAAASDPGRPPVVGNSPYAAEMECARCGKRKIVGFGTGSYRR